MGKIATCIKIKTKKVIAWKNNNFFGFIRQVLPVKNMYTCQEKLGSESMYSHFRMNSCEKLVLFNKFFHHLFSVNCCLEQVNTC